ncbi:MAG: class I SAM-dependent methyltransferase [Nitrosomonas sp.]|nr:MAG: class I SAM-dependent methyltransferase [Nitrosomonas sp.]
MKKNREYIPAFHFHALTRWYDPVVGSLFPEVKVKTALIAQTPIHPEETILDIGCGTGTLTLLIKQTHPDATVHGLDIDPEILQIAQVKADAAGMALQLQHGPATHLPYPNQSLDHVFTSLMMHHLKTTDKQRMLQEVFRVLKPGGYLHVADFGAPHTVGMRLISLLIRRFEEIHDNASGLLPVFMKAAGFDPVRETGNFRSLFGTVTLHCATKPLVNPPSIDSLR